MFYDFRSKIEHYPLASDAMYSLFYGCLSLALGELQVSIPGIAGGYSDFREIPLIISVFYIKNPLFFIISALLTSINLDPNIGTSAYTTFIMHVVPLVVSWFIYKNLSKLSKENLIQGFVWVLYVFFYYTFLLIPLMILSDKYLGVNSGNFGELYRSILHSVTFEMTATALIAGLFLLQYNTRRQLSMQQVTLEETVSKRTKDLKEANDKLSVLNRELALNSNEVKALNQNLDIKVKERSQKIQDQLTILIRYAHMNSHEVRAPLARILGLLEILKTDENCTDTELILEKLMTAGIELDKVVKDMNRLLEREIITDTTQKLSTPPTQNK